jgi:hypothetical protein
MRVQKLTSESEACLRQEIRKLIGISKKLCSDESEIARISAIHWLVGDWFHKAQELDGLRAAVGAIVEREQFLAALMRRVHRMVDEEFAKESAGPRPVR